MLGTVSPDTRVTIKDELNQARLVEAIGSVYQVASDLYQMDLSTVSQNDTQVIKQRLSDLQRALNEIGPSLKSIRRELFQL